MEQTQDHKPMNTMIFIVVGLFVAFLIGTCAVFLSSNNPDGLESAALFVQGTKELFGESPENGDLEVIGTGIFEFEAPIPDYTLERGEEIDVLIAIGGTLLTFLTVFGFAWLLVRKKNL
jgi:cobalt/nickel transport protein